MAALRKQIARDSGAATVWSALRDFGAAQTRVGRASRYYTVVQVFPERDGRSRLVRTIDLLPNDLASAIAGMMDHAAGFMKKTLEAA